MIPHARPAQLAFRPDINSHVTEMARDSMSRKAPLVAHRNDIQRPKVGKDGVDRGFMAQQITLAPDEGRDHLANSGRKRLCQGNQALRVALGLLAAIAEPKVGELRRRRFRLGDRRAGRSDEHH